MNKLIFSVCALACVAIGHSNAQSVAEWQKRAIAEYPDLARQGSTLHQAFMLLYEAAKDQKPELLAKPDWPMRLAASAAQRPDQIVAEQKLVKAAALVQPEDRKAFDNLYFGDSEELTQFKLAHSAKLISENARMPDGGYATFYALRVDERSYAVQVDFHEGKLYRVSFVQTFGDISRHFASHNRKWGVVHGDLSQYNSVIKDSWQILREIAISRFGEPTKSKGYPNILNVENFFVTPSDVWEVGKRRVTLGVVQAIDDIGPILAVGDEEVLEKLSGLEAAKRKGAVKAAAGGF